LAAAEAEIDRLLPAEIAPLLRAYPPPACDLSEAEAVMEQPVPTPPDVAALVDQ
jgi:hypothetical protein